MDLLAEPAVGRRVGSPVNPLRDWLRRNGVSCAAAVVVLALALFVIAPVLDSGYSGDDVPNSQVPYVLEANGTSIGQYIWDTNTFWMENFGRFFPASHAETPLIFELLPDRAAYKAFQVGMVLLDVALAMLLVALLTRSRGAAILAGALLVASLQIRFYHDPILSFSAQQPMVVGFVLGAFLCLRGFLVSGRRWWLVPSALLWLLCLTTYETTYLLTPVFVVMAWLLTRERRRRLIGTLTVLVPVVVLGIFIAYLRSQAADQVSPAYTSNFDPGAVIPTYLKQIVASIPTSYSSLAQPGVISRTTEAWVFSGPADALVFAATFLLVSASVLWILKREKPQNLPLTAITGAFLWLAPALVVATTKRWQEGPDHVTLGLGYVSVYVQYFGVALLFVAIVAGFVSFIRSRIRDSSLFIGVVAGALALIVAFTIQVTADNNDRVVAAFGPLRTEREMFQHAVERGLLDSVRPGSNLVSLAGAVGWVNAPFIEHFGGPKLDVLDGPVTSGTFPDCMALEPECLRVPPRYATLHSASALEDGQAVVGRITAVTQPVQSTRVVLSRDIFIYIESPELAHTRPGRSLRVVGAVGAESAEGSPSSQAIRAKRKQTEVLERGGGWALLHADFPSPVALGTVHVELAGN